MIRVRSATAADLPSILAIERASATAAHWDEREYTRAMRAGTVPQRVLLVAEQDAVLGFVMVRALGEEWELENIVVADRERRRGLASELMREMIGQARRRGAGSIILEVRESNHAARKLYERWGFTEEGRRRAYYSSPTEDALLFRLSFPQPPRIPVEGP